MTILIDQVRLKRGSQSAVNAATLLRGEPAIAIDTRSMWVGDGTGKIKISDIVVVSDYASLPGTGETNKLYLVVTDETLSNESSLYVYKAAQYVLVTCGTGTLTVSDITDFTTGVNTVIDNRRGSNDGIAPLDTGGKIPSSYLPDLSITDVHVVADNAARDALSVQAGDIAIVTGTNTTYIYTGSTWQEMLTAPDGITQVNGQTGPVVSLTTTNISEGTNLYFTDARAKTAVIDDSAGVGDTNLGWSANKIESEITANNFVLGNYTLDESSIGDGKMITFNGTNSQLEYHDIAVDGGEL
jgi:hypothetical protein